MKSNFCYKYRKDRKTYYHRISVNIIKQPTPEQYYLAHLKLAEYLMTTENFKYKLILIDKIEYLKNANQSNSTTEGFEHFS